MKAKIGPSFMGLMGVLARQGQGPVGPNLKPTEDAHA